MTERPSFHMTPEEFRRAGRRAVDWIADYMESVESYPVLSQSAPGETRSNLPGDPPAVPESFDATLEDVTRVILPGITHWQSPSFFGYFPANASGPSILGELISAGLGVQGMMWSTSPACTELEAHVLDWLVDALALPEGFLSTGLGGGVIQDSASSATLCAMIAARERITGGRSNVEGVPAGLVAYASTEAHSSVEKAGGLAGIGRENVRRIDVDENFAMLPDALDSAVRSDLLAGRRPFFVCATAGTTSSLSFDPVPAIAAVCRHHGLWLHVDAAMAGSAALCPEFRFVNEGLEDADSYCFNPHKWLFTNFDCDCFYVADRASLTRALGINPEYLRQSRSTDKQVTDYRDWQIPLGRRFRSLKLWFTLRYYGIEGLRHHLRQHVAWAGRLADRIAADDRFEVAAPVRLNLVCFRHRGGDTVNARAYESINRAGRLFLTHTRLADRLTLRICVGQTHTQEHHVSNAWTEIQSHFERLEGLSSQ